MPLVIWFHLTFTMKIYTLKIYNIGIYKVYLHFMVSSLENIVIFEARDSEK